MSEFSVGDRVMIDSDGSYDNDGATGFATVFLPESKRSELGRLNKRGSEKSGGIPVNAVKFEDRGWNATTWVRAD